MIEFPEPPEGGVPYNNWLRTEHDKEWLLAESSNPAVRSFVRMLKERIAKKIFNSPSYWCSNGGVQFFHKFVVEFVERYGEKLYGSPVVHMSDFEDTVGERFLLCSNQPMLVTHEFDIGIPFNEDQFHEKVYQELLWRYEPDREAGFTIVPFLPLWSPGGVTINPDTFEPVIHFYTWFGKYRSENT